MKRKLQMAAVVMMTVLVGLFAMVDASFAEIPREAVLKNIKGDVSVKKIGSMETVKAADKMVVVEGDTVRTGGGAAVILRFDDGSMMKIGGLSSLTIGKMLSSEGGQVTRLDISAGRTWSRAKKLTGGSKFEVKTVTAVAGVRGTYFSAEVENDTTSSVDVYDGSVEVSSAQNPANTVLVSANQTTTIKTGKAPAKPAAIPEERLEKDRNGFTPQEYLGASFDVQTSVNPSTLAPGVSGVLSVRVLKDGAPYTQQISMHLKLSGSATFESNGASEMDAITGSEGTANLGIVGGKEGTVNVEVRLKIRMKKEK